MATNLSDEQALADEFENILKMVKAAGIDSLPSLRLGARFDVIWSETMFQDRYVQKAVTECVNRPSGRQLAHSAKLFLNFYVGNCDDDKIRDSFQRTVLLLWSGMKINDKYLTADKFHKPSSTSDGPQNEGVPRSEELALFNAYGQHQPAWLDLLLSKLSNDPSTADQQKEREFQLAVNYVGFLAMTLMRLIVCNGNNVKAQIRSHTTKDFEKFWGTETRFGPCAEPHDRLINLLYERKLRRNDKTCNILLAYLVESYLTVSGEHVSVIKDIFNTACLQSLAFNGMACYTWFLKAAESENISPNILMAILEDVLKHNLDVQLLKTFIAKYPENPAEKSWPWARLFDNDALSEISNRYTSWILAICAAIVNGSDPNHQMWTAPQFKFARQNEATFRRNLALAEGIKKIILKIKTVQKE